MSYATTKAPIWLGRINVLRICITNDTLAVPGWTYAGRGSNMADLKNPDSWRAAKRTDARIYSPLLGISYVLDSAAGRWFALPDVHANRARSRDLENIRTFANMLWDIYRVPIRIHQILEWGSINSFSIIWREFHY